MAEAGSDSDEIQEQGKESEQAERARHLLKTAARAKQSENFKRELSLLEEALVLVPMVTPQLLRRYAMSLAKCGEERAAALVMADARCKDDGDAEMVDKFNARLRRRGAANFVDVVDRCNI